MLLQRSKTVAQGRPVADAEHRIRLLTSLAGALAELGLMEEMLEACKTIARLRNGPANAGSGHKAAPLALRLIGI